MYHVFLADDEPWALAILKNLIEWNEYGFAVSGEAEDGRQAMERIERMKPDLILSDIRMPGMDGLTLLERLREKGIKSQVLLVSGYTDFEYARRALQLGCAGYLVKPVEEKDLIEALERVRARLDEASGQETDPGMDQGMDQEGYVSEKQQVQQMVQYIQEHYAEGLTLQVLAERFGKCETYISSQIKKRTGKGFTEHLTEVRIQKAQELLQSTNDSIESVAARVGYPDYYYFTKVYKKTTGISPAAYRKQL
ncbi:MAG: response regulator [Eubacteriales bacterium]|nr:response regulator [Eubacteriales bacterium]